MRLQNADSKDAECHTCSKKDHIACRSKLKTKSNSPCQEVVKETSRHKPSTVWESWLYKLWNGRFSLVQVERACFKPYPSTSQSRKQVTDHGAEYRSSSVNYLWNYSKGNVSQLEAAQVKLTLKAYTDEPMQNTGQLNVHIQYGSISAPLVLVVVTTDRPSLFGRNWLKYISPDWNWITTIWVKSSGLDALLQKHELLFKEEVGIVQPQKTTLYVKPDSIPRFLKPHPVPFTIKDAIGQELDRLEKQGIIRKVDSSAWAAPIVADRCTILFVWRLQGHDKSIWPLTSIPG